MYTIGCSIVLFNNSKNQLSTVVNCILNNNLNIKLYLIDNSPSDILKDVIVDERIQYIHNPSNPGFGSAHNIAINKSIKSNSKYHLVLNPDIKFDSGVLELLSSFMDQNTEIGNLMPKVYYPNGEIQYLCKLLPTPYDWIGRRFNPFKFLVEKRNNFFELRYSNYNKIMDVPYLSGCFMFLRIDALRNVGLFDENIFMYGEETDLCRRLNAKGYRTVFNPEVSIIHEFQKGSHKSWHLTKIGIKSAIYYFNKWGWFFDSERNKINKKTLLQLYKS
jgi:GT2 family glycosyltransferase